MIRLLMLWHNIFILLYHYLAIILNTVYFYTDIATEICLLSCSINNKPFTDLRLLTLFRRPLQ